MIAFKSPTVAALALLATSTLAAPATAPAVLEKRIDRRRLVGLPGIEAFCNLWQDACYIYLGSDDLEVQSREAYCEPGGVFGGTSNEAAVFCTFVEKGTNATVDVTDQVVPANSLTFPSSS